MNPRHEFKVPVELLGDLVREFVTSYRDMMHDPSPNPSRKVAFLRGYWPSIGQRHGRVGARGE